MNPPYIHFSGFSLGDSAIRTKKELLILCRKNHNHHVRNEAEP